MKKAFILFCFFLMIKQADAQCPPGASAVYTHYIQQTGLNTFDTSCAFHAFHFPTNSKVYFYDINTVLRDSVFTDATGYGYVYRTSTNCVFLIPSGISFGSAVSGSCTTNLSFIGLLPVRLKSFSVITAGNTVTDLWQLADEEPNTTYQLQESSNGTDFHTIYSIVNTTSSTPGKQYQHSPPQALTGKMFYRLKIIESTGAVFYSPIRSAGPKGNNALDIYPTIGKDNFIITVSGNFIGGQLQVFNTNGAMIQNKRITSFISTYTPAAGTGMYHVRAIAPDGAILVKRIVVQ
jgi:hypothetical protein